MSVNKSIRGGDSAPGDRLAGLVADVAASVGAYQRLLDQLGVRPDQIRSVRDFQERVPVIDKASWFAAHDIGALCRGGTLDGVAGGYTSSGYSGVFSYGLETAGDAAGIAQRVDGMLALFFGVDRRRTLLVNGLPMGVRVPSSITVVCDVGLRADAAHSVVRKLGPEFEQIVIIAEHPFLKKVLEEGVEAGVDWKRHVVNLVTGAEIMPENFRTYAGGILGHDPSHPERGYVAVSLGISEVGLSIGQETPACRQARAAAHRDAAVRRAIFGDAPFCGTLVRCSPDAYFIETPLKDGRPALIVTTLDGQRKIPLVRYATGDWARVVPAAEMEESLRGCGVELTPEGIDWPYLVMLGRGRSMAAGGVQTYPEQVKEAIYSDPAVAGATTANFRMEEDGDQLLVRFQLKPGVAGDAAMATRFEQALRAWTPANCRAELVPYHDFRQGMELSYQRKFQYL